MRRMLTAIVAILVLSTQAGEALKQRTVPSRDYSIGSRDYDIPPSAQRKFRGVEVQLTRESWPMGINFILSNGQVQPNTAVVVSFERTLDNGANWQPFGSCTFDGGEIIGRDGLPVPV